MSNNLNESDDLDDAALSTSFDDLDNDLLQDPPLQTNLSQSNEQADSDLHAEHVRVSDFEAIGLADCETRIGVIRDAADRRASEIAKSQLDSPSEDKEAKLAEVVTATYRLIDPRLRTNRFHQIRVGRVLPLALQRAGRLHWQEFSTNTNAPDRPIEPVLFGHRLTVQPSVAGTKPSRSSLSTAPPAPPIRQRKRGRLKRESHMVLAELRSHTSVPWLSHWKKTPIALLGSLGAVLLVAFGLTWWMLGPSNQTDVAQSGPIARKTIAKPTPMVSIVEKPSAIPTPLTPAPRTNSSVNSLEDLTPKTSPSSVPKADPPSLTNPVAEPNDGTKQPSTNDVAATLKKTLPPKPNTSVQTAPNASEMQNVNQLKVGNANPSSKPEVTSLAMRDAPRLAPKESPNIEDPKKESRNRLRPNSFSNEELQAAIDELWHETESTAVGLTKARAPMLSDQWDLIGELAGEGSLEHAAASHLTYQASWLMLPFDEQVKLIRFSQFNLTSSDTVFTAELSAICLKTWRGCRAKVTATSDLNHMLDQGNVLLDRILVSPDLSPDDRQQLLNSFTADMSRLKRLATSESSIVETDSLIDAVETLPSVSELNRLKSAETRSGLLGKVLCLKQRQWETGLEPLTRTSDLGIAACAKAELKLKQQQANQDLDQEASDTQQIAIAERWSKLSTKLPSVEAANVRLHALELLDACMPETASQCEEQIKLLPSYLLPPEKRTGTAGLRSHLETRQTFFR